MYYNIFIHISSTGDHAFFLTWEIKLIRGPNALGYLRGLANTRPLGRSRRIFHLKNNTITCHYTSFDMLMRSITKADMQN